MAMTDWRLGKSHDFRGQAVRYDVMGDGPPVVFVHGTPFSAYVWHRIAPLIARHRRVFLFDLLGYGQSEKRAGQDVSLGIQNALLADLLDHWKLESPDVVAHDFGGATALRTHLLNRRDFRSLTLIDPVALAPWGSPFVQHVRAHEEAFRGLPPYIHAAILPAYIRGAVKRTMPADELQPYLLPWLGETGQAAFYRQIAQMDQRYTDDVEPSYGAVRCPTRILWGEDDAWLPIEQGRRLQARIPGAELRPVANAGHLVQEDAPEAIVAALMEIL
jgi:pimeloyl-ACP methyl ester carboxylesterase